MKSFKQSSVRFKSYFAIPVLVCLFLSFTSCQKEEGLQPPASSTLSNSEKLSAGPQFPAYEVLKIDHRGTRGTTPDYEVIVSSDNIVTFIGRRNVSFEGKTTFNISGIELAKLNALFSGGHFFDISEKPLFMIDAPVTYTTFNDGVKSLTLVDYNNGIPAMLIQMREQTEHILDISPYIYPFDEAGH